MPSCVGCLCARLCVCVILKCEQLVGFFFFFFVHPRPSPSLFFVVVMFSCMLCGLCGLSLSLSLVLSFGRRSTGHSERNAGRTSR
jgi:hypothetical protein